MRRARPGSALLSLATMVLGGCADIAPPAPLAPEPIRYQQRRAERWDPWPEPDTGPDVQPARPPEFQDPPSEVKRARRH